MFMCKRMQTYVCKWHVTTCGDIWAAWKHMWKLLEHMGAHTYVDADAQDAHAQKRGCKTALFSEFIFCRFCFKTQIGARTPLHLLFPQLKDCPDRDCTGFTLKNPQIWFSDEGSNVSIHDGVEPKTETTGGKGWPRELQSRGGTLIEI